MSKVYIVQEPLRKVQNPDGSSRFEAAFDLSPALAYGELEVCLQGKETIALTPAPMIASLRHALRNFSAEDYLVPTGDPAAMVAASMIAAQNTNGNVNVLKWDRRTRKYHAVTLKV